MGRPTADRKKKPPMTAQRTPEELLPKPSRVGGKAWREKAQAEILKPYTTISGMFDKIETRKAGDVAPTEQGTFRERSRKRKKTARRALSTSLEYQDTLG
jgi:hypothetical protein